MRRHYFFCFCSACTLPAQPLLLTFFFCLCCLFFFFNDTATTEIYTLSLHDALPILQIGGKPCEFTIDLLTLDKGFDFIERRRACIPGSPSVIDAEIFRQRMEPGIGDVSQMGSGVASIYCRQARPFNQHNGETSLLQEICSADSGNSSPDDENIDGEVSVESRKRFDRAGFQPVGAFHFQFIACDEPVSLQ